MPTNDDAVIILETPDIADISIFAEDPAQLDMDTIERGPAGRDATINGVNTLTLIAERGLYYTQEGDILTLFVDPVVSNALRWADMSEEEKQKYADYRHYLLDFTTQENWWESNPLTLEEWSK